jgi:hypothetical protein
MPSIEALQVGRQYSDADIGALDPNRRPHPPQPFGFDAPAPGRGQGNTRRSLYGDKWCAYCQTPLPRSWNSGACEDCRETRDLVRERVRSSARSSAATASHAGHPAAARNGDSLQNYQDVQRMLDAVNRLSTVVGMASAQRYRNGGMKSDDVEDMLVACKDVMVAADPLRRRMRQTTIRPRE